MENPPERKDSGRALRTLDLTPVPGEMIKPAELIDIDGATDLTLAARRLYNQLIAHAFGPDMGKEGQEWTVRISDLRGTHKGTDFWDVVPASRTPPRLEGDPSRPPET